MHRPIAKHRLRLAWQHTWPHGGADFTARTDGGFVRVYKRTGGPTDEPWFWSAARTGKGALGTGLAATKREACEAAESCWFAAF